MEFLIAFVPVFLLFLALLQVAAIAGAKVVVGHAAVQAARSAAVVLDDDPSHYGGEPRGSVAVRSGGASAGAWAARALGAATGDRPGGGPERASRLDTIRLAAHAALAVLAPSPAASAARGLEWIGSRSSRSIASAVGAASMGRLVFGAATYAPAATAVTFPTKPGSARTHTDTVHGALVTARVTHLFHCGMPVVARLLCDRAARFLGSRGSVAGEPTRGSQHDAVDRATRELRHVESPRGLRALAASGAWVYPLEAEATLPNQIARYHGGAGGP